MPHCKLIGKLKAIGINSQIISWISAYLRDRSQYVQIKNIKSDQLDVYSGVPQGSVLGPILFLVYVNDIHACIEPGVTLRLFADDCIIYTTVQTTEDQTKLNSSLANISAWCTKWGMQINATKTKCISITQKRQHICFDYNLFGHS